MLVAAAEAAGLELVVDRLEAELMTYPEWLWHGSSLVPERTPPAAATP
jgi:hypothetical protein